MWTSTHKDDIYKELDLIQSCITRMAENSFSMKGWHIGIISALIAFFFSKESINLNIILILIAAVTLAFWYLDSYYLMLERKYRWKYAWVLKNRINTASPKSDYLFDLNPDNAVMWETDKNSKGYVRAKKTIDSYRNHKCIFITRINLLREVLNVMCSNTMEVHYLVVFAASFLIFVVKIFNF